MSTDAPSQSVEAQRAEAQRAGGVHTVHRALDVLETVAETGGAMSLAEISARADIPAPTVHRLCKTLVERGYMRQLDNRTYTLGFRLVRLGNATNDLISRDAQPVLNDLVVDIGETANLAVLTGHKAEYVAQAPARFSMRMFTELGRRVDLHSTGVGKAMLAQLGDDTVRAILRQTGLPQHTQYTISTEAGLLTELDQIRGRGYALDEQEEELGVRCVAVPVGTGATPWMALSVSGPMTRLTDEVVHRAVPLLRAGAERLAVEVNGRSDGADED